ncbi:MAG TPA: hypothetical protein VI035_06045 [Solirubrobacterales bacterium]
MAGKALRRLTASLIAVGAILGACAGPAGAATVLVGAPGGGGPGGGTFTNFGPPPVTLANTSLGEAGAHVTSPVNGTIVRWRVTTTGTGQYVLRVLRPAPGSQYTAISSSAANVTVAGENVFTTNRAIQAGDLIGVDIPDDGGIVGHFLIPDSAYSLFSPAPADGSTVGISGTPFTGVEALFNADVEYQDTTQPPSPTSPGSSAKKCKKKKKHKRSAESAKKKCKKKKKR